MFILLQHKISSSNLPKNYNLQVITVINVEELS